MPRKPSGPLPEGFRYLPEFVSAGEERALLERMPGAAFREVRMRGQVALRRTAWLRLGLGMSPGASRRPSRCRNGSWTCAGARRR